MALEEPAKRSVAASTAMGISKMTAPFTRFPAAMTIGSIVVRIGLTVSKPSPLKENFAAAKLTPLPPLPSTLMLTLKRRIPSAVASGTIPGMDMPMFAKLCMPIGARVSGVTDSTRYSPPSILTVWPGTRRSWLPPAGLPSAAVPATTATARAMGSATRETGHRLAGASENVRMATVNSPTAAAAISSAPAASGFPACGPKNGTPLDRLAA